MGLIVGLIAAAGACNSPRSQHSQPAAPESGWLIDQNIVEAIGEEVDPSLGLPVKVRHRSSGVILILIRPGEFVRTIPVEAATREQPATGQVGPVRIVPTGHLTVSNGRPTRQTVKITQPFYIGECEVTQAEWNRVSDGGAWTLRKGDVYPAHAFGTVELNQFLDASGLRLPTECEWEFAARAGDTGARPEPFGQYAWSRENTQEYWDRLGDPDSNDWELLPVKLREPNAWGLYDTIGNVCEICADQFIPDFRSPPAVVADFAGPTQEEVRDSGVTAKWTRRTRRGGASAQRVSRLTYSWRSGKQGVSSRETGFRVALSPLQQPAHGKPN
jgi:formylglycine-generating enzyme required for sulfatase activity